jgi:hypothetical protein
MVFNRQYGGGGINRSFSGRLRIIRDFRLSGQRQPVISPDNTGYTIIDKYVHRTCYDESPLLFAASPFFSRSASVMKFALSKYTEWPQKMYTAR